MQNKIANMNKFYINLKTPRRPSEIKHTCL